MSASLDHAAARRRPPTLAAPHLEFDLAQELSQLRREPAWSSGQNAKTLVKYDDLRVVLIVLKAGGRIAGHQTEGRISIHTLQGEVRVKAQNEAFDLPAGHLLTLDHGVPHDVEAVAESAFLLTIAWRRS